MADLTETQITALSAFLSSPSTTPAPAPTPLAQPTVAEGEAGPSGWARSERRKEPWAHIDLDDLKIETDLRRNVRADIAHQRQVGSYRGRRSVLQCAIYSRDFTDPRRHALGLPVRGQNTRNNAHTAKKLNRVERRAYSSPTLQGAFTRKSVILSLLGR